MLALNFTRYIGDPSADYYTCSITNGVPNRGIVRRAVSDEDQTIVLQVKLGEEVQSAAKSIY